MIFRHPHILEMPPDKMSAEEGLRLGAAQEKGHQGKTVLRGPKELRALAKAYIMQDKAAAVGFDWEKPADVWEKVDEEIAELKEAVDPNAGKAPGRSGSNGQSNAHVEEEFGDALFALVNAARLYGIDPSAALTAACEKFKRRFTYMETHVAAKGLDLGKMELSEMDAIWDEGKAKGL